MAIAGLTQAPSIKIDHQGVTTQLHEKLAELRVELSYGVAGRFQMKFVADERRDSNVKVGGVVTIGFDDDRGRSVTLFKGTITSLALEFDLGERQLIAEGYDMRSSLRADRNVRTFTNQSYKSVLETLAQEAKLSPQIDASLSKPRHPHLLHAGSDQELVAEIARRTGMEWYADDSKLVVAPRANGATVKLEGGTELRRFSARYTSVDHPSATKATGWDPNQKRAVVGSDTSSMKSPTSTVPIEESQRPSASRTAVSWATPVGSVDEANDLAKGLARRMTTAGLVGRGEATGNPAIKPGVLLDISGLDDDWNGKYFVTAAEHIYGRGETYITRFTVGSSESTGLVDLLGTSPSNSAGGLTSGVTIGIVTNNFDSQNTFKHHVKVKFPYLGDSVESAWARVATIGGGPDRGITFMPEVGDEVLVAFEHGNLQRPYVVGSLWNGKDKIPLPRSDGENRKKRSIVSKAGHQITFYDGDGDDKNSITIELAGGATKVHVGKDKVEVIAADGKPIEVKNDKAKVVFSGAGDLTLSAEKITLDARQTLELKGNEVKVSSKANTSVTASAKLELKSTAPAKLESTAILELKGLMVKVN